MYAVIKTGGKQYRVAKDDVVKIERVAGEAGATIEFAEVLLVGSGADVKVGAPTVAGAKVSGSIVEQGLGEKLVVFKFRRRKNYVRRNGHRQELTAVKIDTIVG